MGLSNSPATFQRLMDLVLRGLTWQSVLVYIDDIFVYGKSFTELRDRLEEVFISLRQDKLKLKPTKVRIFQKQILFLGHIVSAEGIATDPAKIALIVGWSAPTNLFEVR